MHTGPGCFSQHQDTPQFFPIPPNNKYTVTINQNYVIGSEVLRVLCVYRDGVHNDTEIVYGITPEDNLTINNASGVVSLRIDARDLPGSGARTPIAMVFCRYADIDHLDIADLVVTYHIQNEYVPRFTDGGQVLSVGVREDQIEREGPIIAQFNVTDDDQEPCNFVTFTIVSGNNDGSFRIGSENGTLELNNNLDYDSDPNTYNLTIRATNTRCGDRQYQDETSIYVYVIDIDDEQPTFEQHFYNFTFDENEQPRDFVQLRCSDADSPGVQIVYDESFSQSESTFVIDHNTGYVSATDSLDYEQQTSYNLSFTCYIFLDSRSIIRRDVATVLVYINPVNEHAPILSRTTSFISRLDYATPVGTVLVSASHSPHALVNITASDRDRGLDHGKIRFTLQNGTHNRFFHLDVNSGDLILIRPFDFDVCSSADSTVTFTIRIVACDDFPDSSRYEEMCPTFACVVSVSALSSPDVCTLIFLETRYTATISELADLGSELLEVHCVVPGGGPSQKHNVIEILSPNSSLSRLLRSDGNRIVLGQQLDYESTQNFTVILTCSDVGGQVSNASLFVEILPENDNPPYFDKPLYFFKVSSNSEIICSIIAFDDDQEMGNNLTYTLSPYEFFNHAGSYREPKVKYFTIKNLANGSAAITSATILSQDTYYVFDIIANDSVHSAQSMILVYVLSSDKSPLTGPFAGTEQCGRICIVFLVLLVTFMLTSAALVILVCVKFYQWSRKRKQWLCDKKSAEFGQMMELKEKSETKGYSTIQLQGITQHEKMGHGETSSEM